MECVSWKKKKRFRLRTNGPGLDQCRFLTSRLQGLDHTTENTRIPLHVPGILYASSTPKYTTVQSTKLWDRKTRYWPMYYGQSDCGPKNHPEPSNISNRTEPSSHNSSAISQQGEFLMGIEPLTQTYSTTILQKNGQITTRRWCLECNGSWRSPSMVEGDRLSTSVNHRSSTTSFKRICLKYIIKPRKKEAKKGEELKMWPPYLCVSAERLHQFWI